MEDACHILSVALILNYKRSMLAKEKREPSPKGINRKETRRKTENKMDLKVVTEEKSQRSIGNNFFLLSSCFLFIYGDVFDG